MALNPIPLPWMLAGGLATTIAAFVAGGYTGRALCQNGYFKASQKAEVKQDAVVVAAQSRDQLAANREVVRQSTVREIIREVPKIIDRPVYHNVCVDADGVQLLERAVAAANDRPTLGGVAGATPDVRPTPDH